MVFSIQGLREFQSSISSQSNKREKRYSQIPSPAATAIPLVHKDAIHIKNPSSNTPLLINLKQKKKEGKLVISLHFSVNILPLSRSDKTSRKHTAIYCHLCNPTVYKCQLKRKGERWSVPVTQGWEVLTAGQATWRHLDLLTLASLSLFKMPQHNILIWWWQNKAFKEHHFPIFCVYIFRQRPIQQTAKKYTFRSVSPLFFPLSFPWRGNKTFNGSNDCIKILSFLELVILNALRIPCPS